MMNSESDLRIVLAGSVSFSRVTLEKLVSHHAHLVGVLGLSQQRAEKISDYARLDDLALAAGAEYLDFDNINSPEVVSSVERWRPDILFIVGLSQLVRDELIAIPTRGPVGFHPTALPKGRGRAPVAWLTYDSSPGAATFFLLVAEADAGPIFVQEPFEVPPRSYASDTVELVRMAIGRALDRWLPSLLAGEWEPSPQNEAEATFFGKRAPEDGLIDWKAPAAEIERLVRSTSRPYPGAYTYARDAKVVIWRATAEKESRYRGVIGRILDIDPAGLIRVQTGDGVLQIDEIEIVAPDAVRSSGLRVGAKLGTAIEDELLSIRRRLAALEP
jgi:methionyl-tRNA formyltransferase